MAKNLRVLRERLERERAGDPARTARVEQERRASLDALALSDLRERCGKTQVGLAEELVTSQHNVSRIEHQEDLYLSTLRAYVEALGGRLELAAVFPDGRVLLDPRPKERAARV